MGKTDIETLSEIRKFLFGDTAEPGAELEALRRIVDERDDARFAQFNMARDLAASLGITDEIRSFFSGDPEDRRAFVWGVKSADAAGRVDPWVEMLRIVSRRAIPGDHFTVRVESAHVVEDGAAFSITLRPIRHPDFKVMFGDMTLVVPPEVSRG